MAVTGASPTFGKRGVVATPRRVEARPAARVSERVPVTGDMVLAYIGRNRHKYEPTVEAMERKDGDFGKWSIGWSWPGFFVPVIWLAYRKMWAASAALYFATLAVSYLGGKNTAAPLIFGVVFALFAKSFVVSHAVGRIRRIIADAPNGTAAAITIRDTGGVSVAGAWISVFLLILPVIVAAMQFAAQHHH
jgi:hypothetical protein